MPDSKPTPRRVRTPRRATGAARLQVSGRRETTPRPASRSAVTGDRARTDNVLLRSKPPTNGTATLGARGRATDAAQGHHTPTVTIGEFFGILRRRWITLVLVFVLIMLIAVGLYGASPKTYSAQSAVKIQPITVIGDSGSAKDIQTTTEARIAHSTAVAEIAAKTLGFDGKISTLLARVAVSSPLNSQLLYIDYSASSPSAAADGANAFAKAYLQYRKSVGQSSLSDQGSALTAKVATLQKQLTALPATGSGAQRSAIQSQIESLSARLYAVQSTVVVPGQVVGVAQSPSAPSSPKKMLYLAGGFVLGLIIGVIAAVARDRRDDTLHGTEDAEQVVGAPVLATISWQPSDRHSSGVGSTLHGDADPAELDAYRTIGTKLRSPTTGQAHDRFLVAGVGTAREPNAVVNLAVTLAQQGLHTVLLTTSTGIEHAAGLFDAATPPRDLTDGALPVTAVDGLSVLNLGPEVSLGNVVNSRLDEIGDLLADAEVTLVDAVNLSLSSSTLTLGRLTDVAVMVVDDRRSHHAEVAHAVRELTQVDTVPIGAVLFERRRTLRIRRPGARHRSVSANADRAASAKSRNIGVVTDGGTE